MTRRKRIIWTVVAAVFTAVNLGGAVFAAVAGEPLHAGIHVLLGVGGAWITWRLLMRRSVAADATLGNAAAEEIPGDRLSRIEQSVDAVAIEVERIGESQRFMTKVLSEEETPQPPAQRPDHSSGKPPSAS